MRILVFGAGVLGSLYAAKLQESGHDVTILARGQRLDEIAQYGIVLAAASVGPTVPA
ncbi:MAG TPA: 2-dehydropantoate 2-reductase N-terminal domain-containing protein [Symbiobacteriaceae bacterium]|jgi:2-dehydropantoate 2-reductase